MTQRFELHPGLAQDTLPLDDTAHCRARLMNDSRFPWVILVPTRPDLIELHDLGSDLGAVMMEAGRLAADMQETFGADKTNIAALGNQVPQLHIHVIMRNRTDAAWPGPVWGVGDPLPYSKTDLEETIARLNALLRAV